VPPHVLDKLDVWVDSVERDGLEETRKIPGYHDEPLQGDRRGQRSIRLNRNYRAIYEIGMDNRLEFVSIEEVTKHDY
jgi:toxin HigB-1